MADINQVPERQVWEVVRGDLISYPFQIGTEYADGSFEAWDLTGWTIQGEIRLNEDADTPLALIDGTPDPVQENETKGVYTLSVTPEESADLPVKCVGDVEFVDPDGDPHTYQRFEFKVTKDVTRIAP